MPNSLRLPNRFPVGTKYVLESRGRLVRRYVEFPDGRKVLLPTRKASSCDCTAWQELSIVPEGSDSTVEAPSLRSRAASESAEMKRQ